MIQCLHMSCINAHIRLLRAGITAEFHMQDYQNTTVMLPHLYRSALHSTWINTSASELFNRPSCVELSFKSFAENYCICTCISCTRVWAAPRFLGQEFGNNNSYISRTRFYLCESKIFPIAFAALWLSLAAFTVIFQWCHGLPTSGNRWC
jgi:hypothetical protein